MRFRTLFLVSAITLGSISGCSIAFPWNIVLGGIEFEDKISFNQGGVAFYLMGFRVRNGSYMGILSMTVRNDVADTLRLSTKDFILRLGTDTIRSDSRMTHDSTFVIPPGEKADVIVWFNYSVDRYLGFQGEYYYLPDNFQVDLLPVPYRVGAEVRYLPPIGFRPKVRGKENRRTRFAD